MLYLLLIIGFLLLMVSGLELLNGWLLFFGFVLIVIGIKPYATFNGKFRATRVLAVLAGVVVFLVATGFLDLMSQPIEGAFNYSGMSQEESLALMYKDFGIVITVLQFLVLAVFSRGITTEAARPKNNNVQLKLYGNIALGFVFVSTSLQLLYQFDVLTFGFTPIVIGFMHYIGIVLIVLLVAFSYKGFKRKQRQESYEI